MASGAGHPTGALAEDASEFEAAPGEVQFQLTWKSTTLDVLDGDLVATNVSSRRWRLSGKPVIVPLDTSGQPLATKHVVTAEGRIPDYVEVPPGGRARAQVTWSWWDGTETSAHVRIKWPGGEVDAPIIGPTHPEVPRADHFSATSSGWWELTD